MSDTSSEIYNPTIEALRDESNFYRWKSDITFHLKVLGLTDIVRGAVPRPPTPAPSSPASAPSNKTPEQMAWESSSARALCFIFSHVAPNLQSYILIFKTAPEAWESLMVLYHRPDPASLLRSLNTVSNLRLSEGQPIPEHLAAFEDAWFDLKMRSGDAPPAVAGTVKSLETVLAELAGSEQCKAEYLIESLTEDLWLLAFNMRQKYGAELRYVQVYGRLMQLHAMRERQKDIAREQEEQEVQAVEEEDCTWCRSRGFESAGHGWKACGRLRQFKRRGASSGAR